MRKLRVRSDKSKHNLKTANPHMKNCSIKLKRLSIATIQRYVKNEDQINHKLNIRIHRDEMQIGNNIYIAKENTFNLCLKVSPENIAVLGNRQQNEYSPLKLPHRNLRPRLNLVNSQVNIVQKANPNTANSNLSTKLTYKSVDIAWRHCKKNHVQTNHTICVDDIVMAKLRGHSAWPSIVLDLSNANKVKVEFLGVDSYEKFGFVSVKEITLFKNSSDIILLLLKRNISKFKKAVQEAEMLCGISQSISICNEI